MPVSVGVKVTVTRLPVASGGGTFQSGPISQAKAKVRGGSQALGRLLHGLRERGQGVIPELVEVAAYDGQTLRVERVDAAGAHSGGRDESGFLEDLEVLRDRGTADRHLGRDLGDGTGAGGEQFEDGPPGRVAQGVQHPPLVSGHER